MMLSTNGRPPTYWGLIGLLVFLCISAAPAGFAFALDPSGASLGMTTEGLAGSFLSDYLIPGLFLLCVLGLWSLLIAYGLWQRPNWGWLQRVFGWGGRHWSWGAALLQGMILVAWIVIQVLIVGYAAWLQPFYFGVGMLIVGLCFTASVRGYAATWSQ